MKILNIQEYIKEKYQIKPLTKERLKDIETRIVVATDNSIRRLIKDAISKYGNNADLNFIDTSKVTDMSSLFSGLNFNGDISQWDVSNVKDMSYMFWCSQFNGDISQWDVSNVKDVRCMFGKSSFDGDISNWNIKNIIYWGNMFYGSPLAKNPPKWYDE